MAGFIRDGFNYFPRIGDRVEGKNGKRYYIGTVLESTHKRGRPAVFSRWGFVGCWIQTDGGRKLVVNEIKPLNQAKGGGWDRIIDLLMERSFQEAKK